MLDVILKILILFFGLYFLTGLFFTIFAYLWYGGALSKKPFDILKMIVMYPIIIFEEEEDE